MDFLWDFLAPRTCACCREDLPTSLQGPACGSCLTRAAPRRGRVCRRCGVPQRDLETLCRRCRRGLFAVDAVRAAFPYETPVRELLHAFKYRGHIEAGGLLAAWMAGLWHRVPELNPSQAVLAVPLHSRRLRERGFNQAEVLASAVARAAGLPLLSGLERSRETPARWRRSRAQRLADLEDAFTWKGPPLPRRVLLIDDVCTTGGTLEACAAALQAAGCDEVRAYVLANR